MSGVKNGMRRRSASPACGAEHPGCVRHRGAFVGEPASAEVEVLRRDADDPPSISAINRAEIIDVTTRGFGVPVEAVEQRIDWLIAGGLNVVAVDTAIGRTAGSLRVRFYVRTSPAVSMADCICLATAIEGAHRLATADPASAATARELGLDVIALPDSGGVRP